MRQAGVPACALHIDTRPRTLAVRFRCEPPMRNPPQNPHDLSRHDLQDILSTIHAEVRERFDTQSG